MFNISVLLIWFLALLLRSSTFLQADKLLKALKAHLKQKARKENENQVRFFITYLTAKQSYLVNEWETQLVMTFKTCYLLPMRSLLEIVTPFVVTVCYKWQNCLAVICWIRPDTNTQVNFDTNAKSYKRLHGMPREGNGFNVWKIQVK